jgi:hypothetical protein
MDVPHPHSAGQGRLGRRIRPGPAGWYPLPSHPCCDHLGVAPATRGFDVASIGEDSIDRTSLGHGDPARSAGHFSRG